MRMILIGHRGVGKTSLLQRLQIYCHLGGLNTPVFDLDRHIERETGMKIADIFATQGEQVFRQMELEHLRSLTQATNYIIALGAGFPLDRVELTGEVVWVKRQTDGDGRIFLDRPRLDANLSPLEEYRVHWSEREKLYAQKSNWAYTMPEGLMSPSESERQIFFDGLEDCGGVLTLHRTYARFLHGQFDLYEIRDDLLTAEQIVTLLPAFPKEQILLSCRQSHTSTTVRGLAESGYLTDWALELGEPSVRCDILSLHNRNPGESVQEAIARLTRQGKARALQLKLAVEVDSFHDIELGLNWQAEDPVRRNFLPRSSDGRWRWVRQWLKGRQRLNFIDGGVADQPTLYQWLQTPEQIPGHSRFAAILGHPVRHSYTPVEQAAFFKDKQVPVLSVDLKPDEWATGFALLKRMGMRWAAVTSPLKKLAFAAAGEFTVAAGDLCTANTLVYSGGKWIAHNADVDGLRATAELHEILSPIVVWGGGGTLPVLRQVFPEASFYSVRTGEPRLGSAPCFEPRTVVWAAGPDSAPPQLAWRPQTILDLNYRDDSRAKEYCQKTGARYISGLPMFIGQAHQQRTFWEQHHVSE